MTISFTQKEFRLLLDLVYIGNWVLNSHRVGDEIIDEYNAIESKVFDKCPQASMPELCAFYNGVAFPTPAYEEGGIHEAIDEYDNDTFFEILSEELASRDLRDEGKGFGEDSYEEFAAKCEEYMQEFDAHGIDNLYLNEQ